LCRQSLEQRQALGDSIGIAESLFLMANIAEQQGQPLRAVSLASTAEAIIESLDHEMHPVERADQDQIQNMLRMQLGEARFMEARERGRAASVESAIAEAFTIQRGLS
jgi:hypothetical protein